MSRKDALTVTLNPAKKFYKWESSNKTFSYYDKETQKNILVDLPFRFVLLDRPLLCVKGFNEPAGTGIFSNEVRSVKDELVVRMFDNAKTLVAKGNWNEIKEACVAKGGKYHTSIYAYDLQNEEIINISIKGMAVGEWGTFFSKGSKRTIDEIITVKSFKDGKKGAVKFTYPSFEFERSLSDSESEACDAAYDILKSYLDVYLSKSSESVPEITGTPEDDIDF